MENDPISKWANEAQERANVEYAEINQDNPKEEIIDTLKRNNQSVREENVNLKLQIIEIKEKLQKILQILNK